MGGISAIVVGAGISGLSAARALLARDAKVLVLEAAARAGGVIATENVGGFVCERGPDSLVTAKPEALALCREAGLGERFVTSDGAARKTWIWWHGRLRPVPAGWQMLAPSRWTAVATTSLLSAGAKLRLAREWWAGAEPELGDEPVSRLVRRRFGDEVLEAIVAPMIAGIYGGAAEELGAAALPRFYAMARQGSVSRALWRGRRTAAAPAPLFTALRDGLEELTEALAASLGADRLRLNCRVTAVEEAAGGDYRVRAATGESWQASAVVLALPAWAAAEALAGLDTALAEELAAIPYASAMTLNLGFAEAVPLPGGTGFLVARGEGIRMLACTFMSRKYPGRAAPGTTLLRLFYGGQGDEAALALGDAEARTLAREELRRVLGIAAPPAVAVLARWPRAMAQPVVGHGERLARIDRLRSRHRGLGLAGNAYGGVGIADCIASGRRAAAKVAS